MIQTTPYGLTLFLQAITTKLKTMHLFVQDGELTEHGYAPKTLDSALWKDGQYPEQLWEFKAGDPVDVLGYYVMDADGQIVFTEYLQKMAEDGAVEDAPVTIKNTGDRLGVRMNLNLLGA